MRLVSISLTLGWVLVGVCAAPVRGDGGTIRLSRCEGGYQITVFTAPTPFRAGPVDISVLVQDAATGTLTVEAEVTIQLTPRDSSGWVICHAATTEAATNKLLRAAVFELPEPGPLEVEVTVEGSHGLAQVRFDVEAARYTPKWPAMWLWIGWPAPAIVLFSVHQLLVWQKSRRRPRWIDDDLVSS